MPAETPTTLADWLRNSLANGAVGVTLRTGANPVIYGEKVVQANQMPPSAAADIEELLRELLNSREMRRFREKGAVHFKRTFGGVLLLGGTNREAGEIRVELRKFAP